ncbi:MAG: hypothetical protein M0Z55_08200 [Peptococcaceae bacterium]|nr:hypothetical protein [Peptococcaceae bacterium]
MSNDLSKIEQIVFLASLGRKFSIKELGRAYSQLIHMRNECLNSLNKNDLLTEIFHIQENILNLKIMMREMLGLDIEAEFNAPMKKIWDAFNQQ